MGNFDKTLSFLIGQVLEILLFLMACLCEDKQWSMKTERDGFDSLSSTDYVTVTLHKECPRASVI